MVEFQTNFVRSSPLSIISPSGGRQCPYSAPEQSLKRGVMSGLEQFLYGDKIQFKFDLVSHSEILGVAWG